MGHGVLGGGWFLSAGLPVDGLVIEMVEEV